MFGPNSKLRSYTWILAMKLDAISFSKYRTTTSVPIEDSTLEPAVVTLSV